MSDPFDVLIEMIVSTLPPLPPAEALVAELMRMPYDKRHDYLRVALDGVDDGNIEVGAFTGNDYPSFFREVAQRVAEEEEKVDGAEVRE